jgi:hypothetical protein
MGAIPSLSWNGHRSLLSRVLELINMYVLLLPTETPSNNMMMTTAATMRACIEIEWNHGSKEKASSIDAQTSQR